MNNLQLDWSTAEVSDGKLTVSLDGKPNSDWAASFERTVQLLDHGTWPGVKLKKRAITVKDVEPGTEEKLRFFLDSAVQEANAEAGSDEEENGASEDKGPEDDERDEAEGDAAGDPDQEMTERFRAFGGEERP